MIIFDQYLMTTNFLLINFYHFFTVNYLDINLKFVDRFKNNIYTFFIFFLRKRTKKNILLLLDNIFHILDFFQNIFNFPKFYRTRTRGLGLVDSGPLSVSSLKFWKKLKYFGKSQKYQVYYPVKE